MSLVRLASVGLVLALCCGAVAPCLVQATEVTGEFDTVTLERSPCFGACPEYAIEIRSDGLVIFNGKNDVMAVGIQTRKISSSDIGFLRASIKRMRFAALRDRYESSADGCREVWTDLPGVMIKIKAGAFEKKVSYNTGCRGLPILRKIAWFADTIDEVAGTSQWVGDRMYGSDTR